MLEIKNLVKIYKPKKGVPVTALDNISISFPEKGMIFLLGKSGSGKSTLLNLLGGLDNYNSGEIIIKGVSSKNFKQKHFDSYRNTYVGFIFQEYNVLDEFTVGANIALAIELQNRKATDNEINEILKEVDLEDFGKRRPNELSGGQKQRVAIARALVKKPEIIMADEPTGALDSVTGKQVLDTLKKLSADRLVIVVSHDREFAELYADRIIELADGKIINDIEVDTDNKGDDNKIVFGDSSIEIPQEYHLSEDDRKNILEYIESLQNGKVDLIVNRSNVKKFRPTKNNSAVVNNGSEFKLIKSKLPLKNAFKIGAGALKFKKFRLVMTIFLSCISFGLFGLADTFSAYNHIDACTNSLLDSEISYLSVVKSKKIDYGDGYIFWRDYGYKFSDDDLENFRNNTGVNLQPVFVPLNSNLNFSAHINTEISLTETDFEIFVPSFSGFAKIDDNIMSNMGFKVLAGSLPESNKNEIAVSEYVFETFKRAKYTDGISVKDNNGKEQINYIDIKNYSDLLGKVLDISGTKYTISAVIDTNFNLDRYLPLILKNSHTSTADDLVDYVLYNEFSTSNANSYSSLVMVGDDCFEKMLSNNPKVSAITEGTIILNSDDCFVDPYYLTTLNSVSDLKVNWLNGTKTELGEKELIVPIDAVKYYEMSSLDEEELQKMLLNKEFTADLYYYSDQQSFTEKGYKIVGIIENDDSFVSNAIICSKLLYNSLVETGDNIYNFAVGKMPNEKSDLKNAVSYCYKDVNGERCKMTNSVTWELDTVNETLKQLASIFLYIGLGFAVFAALMLANFIGISISHKKQEIGILRAIGSRSDDVFRIFFAESFVIAMINFTLSSIGVGVATAIINMLLRKNTGILITVLSFTPRQVILLFAVSVIAAFIASYLPVKRIASKRPIDAIRNK